MADHTLDMVRSALRAMQEVVLPAVDRRHPLALEQATLVARMLQLLEQRIPWLVARNRYELEQAVLLGEALAADAGAVSPAIASALAQAVRTGRALLADAAALPPALQQAAHELNGLVTVLVEVAAGCDDAERCRRMERRVVQGAIAVLAMQRAWFLPQGWEPDASAVAALPDLLAPA